MNAVCRRLEVPVTDKLVPVDYHADTWQCRTDGEALYLAEFTPWGEGGPVEKADHLWRDYAGVFQEAIFCQKPLIHYGLRYLKRRELPFFAHTVWFECRFRSDNGFFVAYRMLEASKLTRNACSNMYVRIPSWWQDLELPQGFWAELGSIHAYYSTHLLNP